MITDFHAANILIGLRAVTEFGFNPKDNNVQEGGSKKPRSHNPLTTFYFLLREITFRLTYDTENLTILCKLYNFLKNLLNSTKFTSKDHFYSLEYFLLETLPATDSYIQYLINDIKDGYYGFHGSLNSSYAKSIDNKALIKQFADTPHNLTVDLKIMQEVIDKMKGFENVSVEVSKKPSSKLPIKLPEVEPRGYMSPPPVNKLITAPAAGGSKRRTRYNNKLNRKKKRNGSPRRRTNRKTRGNRSTR